MKKIIINIAYISLLLLTACDNYLDKEPLDQFTNDDYWTSESSLRSYTQDFYVTWFPGYAQDYRAFGGYFSGDTYNDDFLLTSTDGGDRNNRFYFSVTNTSGANSNSIWKTQYEQVRKANVMLEKIPGMNISDDAKKHWLGIGRFFRALAYSTLVKEFGDVPYIDKPLLATDYSTLYKARDARVDVANKILEDFEFAVDNVRAEDGTLQVNKYVVGGFMSRWMLYHGTWLKYHGTNIGPLSQSVDNATLKKYLDGVIKGAEVVMISGKFSIGNTYNALFSSESLAKNPEIVFYREYATGVLCNALLAYNAKEAQDRLGGVTQDAIESYLCIDGLPIAQSPLYGGKTDERIEAAFVNRDPRLYDSFVDTLRIANSGLHSAASPTGYACKKFLNEQWLAENSPYLVGLLSPADAPVIRYAEILLNYVEARYEVSKLGGPAFSQSDLDKSINQIRKRSLTKWGENPKVVRQMPAVTLSGNAISVNGTIINDPKKDADVDAVLWEIRRERRIELLLEGRRGEDLNRWAKFDKLNTGSAGNPTKVVLGAWIKKSDYPKIAGKVKLYNPNGNADVEGYIAYYYYAGDGTQPRSFKQGDITSERNYLRAIPVTEINNYVSAGYKLSQNPGWD